MKGNELTFENAVEFVIAKIEGNCKGFSINTEFGKIVIEVAPGKTRTCTYPYGREPLTNYMKYWHHHKFDYYISINWKITKDIIMLRLLTNHLLMQCLLCNIIGSESENDRLVDSVAFYTALKRCDTSVTDISNYIVANKFKLSFGNARRRLIEVSIKEIQDIINEGNTYIIDGQTLYNGKYQLYHLYRPLNEIYEYIMYTSLLSTYYKYGTDFDIDDKYIEEIINKDPTEFDIIKAIIRGKDESKK